MPHHQFSFEEGIHAQSALRRAARLPPESFSLRGFISSLREKIETLRGLGFGDDQIAEIVREHSSIEITENEVSAFCPRPHHRRFG
jgi:hypothetical protein